MFSHRTVSEAVAITEIAPLTYTNQHTPDRLPDGKAFGGWTIALAINAAAASVKTNEYNLYSAVGHFLAAVEPKQPLTVQVEVIRDTRTFATRFVRVHQQIKGTERPVMTLMTDFQRPEKASLLEYSPPTMHTYTPVEKSLSMDNLFDLARKRGVPDRQIDTWVSSSFGFKTKKFECISAPEGEWGKTVYGLAPAPGYHENDKRRPYDRTTLEYFRSWKQLETQLEHVLAIAYLQDGGTSHVPHVFEGISYNKVAAVGSLDFALRILTNDLDINDYMTREEHPVSAADGRTYVEARMWDRKGRLVSSMTQQCILRPRESKI